MSYARGSVPIRRLQWQIAQRFVADDLAMAGYERAKFGRYVGAVGGTLSASSAGREAWVAHLREKGCDGFGNRAYRRALSAYLNRGGGLPLGVALFQAPLNPGLGHLPG